MTVPENKPLELKEIEEHIQKEYFVFKKNRAIMVVVSFVVFNVAAWGVSYKSALDAATSIITSDASNKVKQRVEEIHASSEDIHLNLIKIEKRSLEALEKIGTPTHQEILAKAFTVVDNEGRALATLREAHDSPSLIFYGSKQEERIKISLREQSAPNIAFLDEDGRERFQIKNDKESYNLIFQGGNEKKRIDIGLNGTPNIALYDDEGKYRSSYYVNDVNTAGLQFMRGEKPSARLYSTQTGVSQIRLFDEDGDLRNALFVNQNGYAGLDLQNGGQSRAVLSSGYGAKGKPRLEFRDKNGFSRMLIKEEENGNTIWEFARGESKKISLRMTGPGDESSPATMVRFSKASGLQYGVFKE